MKLHVLLLLASLGTAQAQDPATHHGPGNSQPSAGAAASSPLDFRSAQLKSKMEDILVYIDTARAQGKNVDLGDIEKALRDFQARIGQGVNMFPNKQLSDKELSLVYDSMDMLSDFATELITLKEANPTASLEELKKLAASNMEKRFRLSGRTLRRDWSIQDDMRDVLNDIEKIRFDIRKLMSEGNLESINLFVDQLSSEINGRVKIDLSKAFEDLSKDPSKFIEKEWKRIFEDLKLRDPKLAAEVEATVKDYEKKANELKDYINKNVAGQDIEGLAENVHQELNNRSKEYRDAQAELKRVWKSFSNSPEVDASQLTDDLKKRVSELSNRAQAEVDNASRKIKEGASDIERKVKEEADNLRKKLEGVLK